jgi:GT2 family glycosyltransferase
MKPPKISIIIVTWNGLHHLKKYLPSVVETNYPNFEIIIADNASDDGTATWIENNYPGCKIAELKKNFGYAGGNNRAAKQAEGEIILFLNNDVKVTPKWLNPIAEAFQDPEVAIVQPKIRAERSPEMFEYAGAAGGFIDWLGYPFCRGRIFDTIENDNGQYDNKTHIFWASGAAFAIQKEVFNELEGFDEEFEFHMEEIDLCWRTLKSGYNAVYIPESTVYHYGGGSLPENSPRKVFYNFRNNLLMLTKNLDNYLVPKIFTRLVLDGLTGIKFLFEGKPENTFAIIKAHFSFYAHLHSAVNKRTDYPVSNRQLVTRKLIFKKLIPVQYFLAKNRLFQMLNF